jgi:hypothetical protein
MNEFAYIITVLLVTTVVISGVAWLMGCLPIFHGWTFWQCVAAQLVAKYFLSNSKVVSVSKG